MGKVLQKFKGQQHISENKKKQVASDLISSQVFLQFKGGGEETLSETILFCSNQPVRSMCKTHRVPAKKHEEIPPILLEVLMKFPCGAAKHT